MEEKDIKIILDRYRAGTASEEEIALLESWYLQHTEHEPEVLSEEERLRTFNAVWANLQPRERRLWPRVAAAASIVLVLGAGTFYLTRSPQQPQLVVQQDKIVPGGNKAILTLANGQKIDLTAAKSGKIAMEQQAAINKTADGQLAYQAAADNSNQVQYNTLSTPIGGRYELTLSDGTQVTLDAESSITYPVSFTGNERKVKMTGQAYFAVKHDEKHPFRVETAHTTIKDIGTEFNVNSYQDEAAEKTTLIEGAVAVNNKTLVPGQQAHVSDEKVTIKKADLESVTAWKENNFLFRGQNLRTTMQQVARWYNVKIIYKIDPDPIHLGGGISRKRELNEVLSLMSGTGLVKFKLKERTITVY